jgi:hypothetical protein
MSGMPRLGFLPVAYRSGEICQTWPAGMGAASFRPVDGYEHDEESPCP